MTDPTGSRGRITLNVLLPLLVAAAVIVGCADGDDASSPTGECETSVATPEIEYRDTSELTDQERQALEVFRGRSASILVEQNPVSCQGMIDLPARVEAEEFGAFEAKSFANADPAIRFDLLFFTERQPTESTIREDISARLSAINEPGSSLRVWAVANTLFIAVTMPIDDADAAAIAEYYNQLIAGEE